MKRKLLIILMALGLLALLPATALAANGVLSGNGDVNDPYIIEDEEDLAAFRDSVNSGNTYAGKYIELRANKTYDLSGQAGRQSAIALGAVLSRVLPNISPVILMARTPLSPV